MEYSTLERWQEVSETGIVYEIGSLYNRFEQMSDPRKARGKRYSLVTLLVIIFLGKLCGQDRPVEIADWAANHTEELTKLLQLSREWIPHHNTIRRVYQSILSEDEFDQMAQEYSQQEQAGRREVLALDGKTLRGTGTSGFQEQDHKLSLYGVESQHVLAQAVVNCKENEITAAPRVLKQVELSGIVVTGDALLAQRTISAQIMAQAGDYIWPIKDNHPRLLGDIQQLFAAPTEEPKPGFGKIRTDFQSTSTLNKGHGRIERRTLETSNKLRYEERNRALILLLIDTGMRASALYDIKIHHVDLNGRQIRVMGKGDKERIVHFSARTGKALWRYLATRENDDLDEWLFVRSDEMPFDRHMLLKVFRRIGNQSDVRGVNLHRFRHTFAINFLRNGGDALHLQRLLGHATMKMVNTYLDLANADLKKNHRIASPVDHWRL